MIPAPFRVGHKIFAREGDFVLQKVGQATAGCKDKAVEGTDG